jgi:hypothetical protein
LTISGAPTPTGIDDGVAAIDDRRYFRAMVAAGIPDLVDAVGIHPYGWSNPPGSQASSPSPEASSHNNHPSFFFADTVLDYRHILNNGGYAGKELWFTEFGWATYDGLSGRAPQGVEYMNDVDEWEQAVYLLDAFEMSRAWQGIGPMFVWNLNIAPILGPKFIESAYSLQRENYYQRASFLALQHMMEAAP